MGAGVSHTIPRSQGSRQGGDLYLECGECSMRRRMLQSEPALHPNQRCGGCAAGRQSFHTKGRPPPSLSKPSEPATPSPPPSLRGRKRGREGGRRTHRQGQNDPVIQTKMDRVGPVGQSGSQHSGDEERQTEGTETLPSGKGKTEERQTWRQDRAKTEEHPESRQKDRRLTQGQSHPETSHSRVSHTHRGMRRSQAQGETEGHVP